MNIMLKDKVMLITGASRGIGKATAILAAENHAIVIINYYQSEKEAEELVESIENRGLRAMMIKANISNGSELKDMFRIIKEKYERLDILVNNAGIMKNNLLMMTMPEELEELFRINCMGTFLCMQYATKMMIKQKSGKIINMSSLVGVNGTKGYVAYSASKSFIIGLTKSAAKELGYYGICVNAIAPGFIDTDLTKKVKEDVKQDILRNISLGRIGKPDDVAKSILFLSSNLGDYVSGQILGVDGSEIM
ncbi:3-oxoacyl-ACP reductase family protein [Methanosphaerula subterraneus]|uniref:3-oxoacyl-ACP reductase family protein n=1 Tax=Methanosphaerula subterraneus TaxID=3350244 RepID=UPI003F86BBDF